jgi:hypothetical protein
VPIPGNPTELASLQRGRPAHRGRGAAQKNAELQAQAGDVTAQTIRIREATESNWKVTKQWREAGEESYNFVENRQWDQKDLDYLKSQGRPAMTLNKCLPQIRLLSVMERQNPE